GNVVNGDKIIYICAKYLKEHNQLPGNKVVVTVMSNFGLFKALDKAEIGYEKTKVGDRYVYENMKENGYVLGGEQSGHIIFSKYATTGDGILTSIMVMEAVLESKKSLGTLTSDVKIYPQLLKNVRVADKDQAMNSPAMKAAIDRVNERLSGDGRVLVRSSGTEPLVRVMVEAASDEICKECVDEIAATIEG
ncbi:MAG: phosphoglucosamine mutase, partial [Lachnospiraceae bacterium]|nr:phosphoglucosamine mutase [Lachnospiraceae bacterium]